MPARAAPGARVLPVSPASRDAPGRLSSSGLYYELAGEGEPVVLIHAGVCDSRMWEPQWRTFPPRHRTLRYDVRGFGRSMLPPAVENARDLIDLVAEVGFERAALVGNSLGGQVALEVAVARPDLVSALVLVAASVRGPEIPAEIKAFDRAEEEALERGDLAAAAEINVRMWVDGHRSAEEVDPAVRELVREMTRLSFEVQQTVPDAELKPLVPNFNERLGEITARTLILVGDKDVESMHRFADFFEREIPKTQRATIANAAHVPSLERPAEFDRLVLPFLAG